MLKKIALLSCLIAFSKIDIDACTGISLKTENNNNIQARTIEWSKNKINSQIIIEPRGKEYQPPMPNRTLGKKWKGKYGFVGASVEHESLIGEGVNEKGLNAGVFFFLNYGELAPFNEKKVKNSLNDMDLVKWMLTSFSTVEEVKEAIKKIDVVPIIIENGQPSPTGHWRVSDAKGGNIVIEIINGGELKIYDNKVGVLTNSPGFDWQLTNLNNYVNLNLNGNKPEMLGQQKIFPMGAGSGMLGLPGDVTPPSRFVRAAFYANNTPKMAGNEEGITQAFHILNNFDIPIGMTYADKNEIPKEITSATQWTTAINLNEKLFYYKTMYNQDIRLIDLKKIDFGKVQSQVLPMDKNTIQPVDEILIK